MTKKNNKKEIPQRKSRNFLEPKVMFKEMLKCLAKDQLSEEMGRMIIIFAENFVKHRNFIRYHDIREDLQSIAILGCTRAWDKFRPMRNNILERDEEGKVAKSERVEWDGKIVDYDYKIHNSPFNFFTTVARNDLFQYLKSQHYKQKNIANELILEMGGEADYGYIDMLKEQEVREREDIYNENLDDDTIDDIIEVADEIERFRGEMIERANAGDDDPTESEVLEEDDRQYNNAHSDSDNPDTDVDNDSKQRQQHSPLTGDIVQW